MENIKHVDGGSAEYWRQRREAFALIREAEEAGERMKTAPLYLHGGYDEDGDVIPIELQDELVMRANGVPSFKVKLGSHKGNLALQVVEPIDRR